MNYVLLCNGNAIYAQFCDTEEVAKENREIEKDGLLWMPAKDYLNSKAKR